MLSSVGIDIILDSAVTLGIVGLKKINGKIDINMVRFSQSIHVYILKVLSPYKIT
jgi:hypothetical protein